MAQGDAGHDAEGDPDGQIAFEGGHQDRMPSGASGVTEASRPSGVPTTCGPESMRSCCKQEPTGGLQALAMRSVIQRDLVEAGHRQSQEGGDPVLQVP